MRLKGLMAAVALAAGMLPAWGMLDDAAALAAARQALAKLTLQEKVALVGGSGTMTLAPIPSLGITNEWTMSDNSSTVRPPMERFSWGYPEPVPTATVLPSLSALAATWDVDLARRHGEVLGSECRARGVDQILGPGVNLMRTPLCGRNWEYLGEDPCLAAALCVPLIRGVQSFDVAATVKHFCLNNQELARNSVDTYVDDRTLNEFYLPVFRAAVKEAGTLALMTSYNKVAGLWTSENRYLQTGVLRERWGYRGLIVSDWGGMHSTEFSAMNGSGIEMDGGYGIRFYTKPVSNRFPLAESVAAGRLPKSTLDDMALRTLYVMAKTGFLTGAPRRAGEINTLAHQRLARQEAAESIVLLKNSADVLPLAEQTLKRVLVIGPLADLEQCGKGGSAAGKALYEVTPLMGITNRLKRAEVVFMPFQNEVRYAASRDTGNAAAAGCAVGPDKTSDRWCESAALKAEVGQADAVIVFVGTEHGYQANMETEGFDRPDMNLPPEIDAAIEEIIGWSPRNLVVVLRSGSPIACPWADKVKTLVHTSYLGMESGNALADVLFGDVNPCGRLAQSWPRTYADTAVAQCGSYNATNIVYHERFYVGYRWHDLKGIRPRFAFGSGLSYTTFGYEVKPAAGLAVAVKVTNTGKRAGKEVVQVYAACPLAKVERPAKELKAFRKVALAPGEAKTLEIRLTERDLAYWDEFANCFRTDAGEYELRVGSSSDDIRGSVRVNVAADRIFAD